MTFLKHMWNKHRDITISILGIIMVAVFVRTFASGSGPFSPGTELNPSCLPTDTNCVVNIFPDQTSNSGKFLQTDGMNPTWQTVTLPPTAWYTRGNSGTVPGTDFIGTTDATDLVFDTDNTEKMRILQNGNVGIGTVAPGETLEVAGNTKLSSAGSLIFSGNHGLGNASIQFTGNFPLIKSFNGDEIQFHANSTGDISGQAGFNFGIEGDPTGTAGNGLYLKAFGNGGWKTGVQYINTGPGVNPDLILVPTVGNVGIGTATPGATLEIDGSSGTTLKIVDGNQGSGKVLTSDSAGQASWQTASSGWSLTGNSGTTPGTNFIGTTDAEDLVFKVNNTQSGFIGYDIGNSGDTYFGFHTPNSAGSYDNTAMGSQALKDLTTGNNNVAIGSKALQRNTDGVENIAIGYAALTSSLHTYDNVAIGNLALTTVTTGTENIAIGADALKNSNAKWNTAVGSEASAFNTSGDENTAIGFHALKLNQTGYQNVGLGSSSLYNLLSGINNVSLGTDAGNTNVSGSNNVYIGFSAGLYATGSNEFYLNNVAQSSLADDKAYSLMYGTFSGTAGSLTGQQLTINGNVGIGTANPGSALEIHGTYASTLNPAGIHLYGGISGISFENSNGGGNNRNFAFTNSYNAPGLFELLYSSTPTGDPGSDGIVLDGTNGFIGIGGRGTSTTNRLGVSGATTIGGGYLNDNAPADGLIVEGNVGIGTASPQEKLQISGGDVYVDNSSNGIILKSATDSHCARVTLTGATGADALNFADITCP